MASEERSLADIASAWHAVATLLSPKDLTSCIQTCKQLTQLTDTEVVWKHVAQKAWHDMADLENGGYETYKAMVLDDNRQNVALAIALPGMCCSWRFQQPDFLYYRCCLLELQWWRSNNTLRLYLDARGESDLRHPHYSSMAVVTLKEHTRAAAAATAAGVAEGSAAGSSTAFGFGITADQHHYDGRSDDQQYHHDQHQQQQAPDQGAEPDVTAGDPSNWSAVLNVFYPDQCHLLVDKPGHYKGVLVWSTEQCGQVLDLLFPLQHQQQQQQQHDKQQQQNKPQQQQQRRRQPPLPQHAHQQRARRTEAFEEWADWQLSHDSEGEEDKHDDHDAFDPSDYHDDRCDAVVHPAAAAVSTPAERHNSCSCHMGALLGRLFGSSSNIEAGTGGSKSSSFAGASAAGNVAGSGSQNNVAAAAAAPSASDQRRALVFCYANTLNGDLEVIQSWSGYPDYTIAALAVTPSKQQIVTHATAAVVAAASSSDPDQQAATSPNSGAAAAAGEPVTAAVDMIDVSAVPPAVAASTAAAQSLDSDPGDSLVYDHVHHDDAVDDGPEIDSNQVQHHPVGVQPLVGLEQPVVGTPMDAEVAAGVWQRLLSRCLLGRAGDPSWWRSRDAWWVSQWCELPGAKLVRRGRLYSELQRESDEDERERWADLPEAVVRRRQEWWV